MRTPVKTIRKKDHAERDGAVISETIAPDDPTSLEELLDRIAIAGKRRDRVPLSAMMAEVGDRSFGPLLLFAGVIAVSPLSGIPGMPTFMGVFVMLIAGQLLAKRDHFWLPGWLLRKSVSRKKLDKALRWLRPSARLIDRALRRRLTFLVRRAGLYAITAVCLLVAATMPVLELVPFAATIAGAALSMFGLALIARDGLFALFGFLFTTGIAAAVMKALPL